MLFIWNIKFIYSRRNCSYIWVLNLPSYKPTIQTLCVCLIYLYSFFLFFLSRVIFLNYSFSLCLFLCTYMLTILLLYRIYYTVNSRILRYCISIHFLNDLSTSSLHFKSVTVYSQVIITFLKLVFSRIIFICTFLMLFISSLHFQPFLSQIISFSFQKNIFPTFPFSTGLVVANTFRSFLFVFVIWKFFF